MKISREEQAGSDLFSTLANFMKSNFKAIDEGMLLFSKDDLSLPVHKDYIDVKELYSDTASRRENVREKAQDLTKLQSPIMQKSRVGKEITRGRFERMCSQDIVDLILKTKAGEITEKIEADESDLILGTNKPKSSDLEPNPTWLEENAQREAVYNQANRYLDFLE